MDTPTFSLWQRGMCKYVNAHTQDTFKHIKAETHLHACVLLYDKKVCIQYSVMQHRLYTHKHVHVKCKFLYTDVWPQKKGILMSYFVRGYLEVTVQYSMCVQCMCTRAC